ncbi:MAG: VOC family protein, partial [Flavobacteriia bacterium]
MVGWFEIPVEDMERAKTFYEAAIDLGINKLQIFKKIIF